ncbi:hypothetical protein TNCV_4154651 [Trichonephila clavipes]|nr:hypothetical protein TNCV_4154651 [Trichonephila clavipes]
MEGKGCVWAEDDVIIAVGIFVLCLDDTGASNFKGGQFILVIFSSVWVELFKVEDLAAFERMFEVIVGLLIYVLLDAYKRSDSEMTPRQEFKVLRGVTISGESIKVLASKKYLLCTADIVSISRSPDRNFLMDLGSPPIPIKAL